MRSFQTLLGLSGFVSIVAGAASLAIDVTETSNDVLSATESTYPSIYIVPNTGTFIYAQTTAAQAWTTPPCTTTEKTETFTPSCPPPPFGNKAQATSAAASTTALTGAALPLRVPKAFGNLARFFRPKREVKQVPRSGVPLHLEARSFLQGIVFTEQLGEASLAPGNAEPNPVREYAFGLGIGNYEKQVSDSIAAFLSGGKAGLTSMWSKYVKDGNPYGLYYLANGKGDPKLARINQALAVNTPVSAVAGAASTLVGGGVVGAAVGGLGSTDMVMGAPTGTFVSNAGLAVLSIMGQVYTTDYINVPLTSAIRTSTTATAVTSSASKSAISSAASSSSSSSAKSAASSSSQASTGASSASTATKTTALSVTKLSSISIASVTSAVSSAKPLVAVPGVLG